MFDAWNVGGGAQATPSPKAGMLFDYCGFMILESLAHERKRRKINHVHFAATVISIEVAFLEF
jgi:hypothetical protein